MRRIGRVPVLAAMLMIATVPVAVRAQTAGNACATTSVATMQASGINLYCHSNVWSYPAYQVGSANGATCASGLAGQVQWTGVALQFCDGSNWLTLNGGGVTGSGSTGYDAIWTSPTAIGTGLIYESGGNVGIGTTSPDQTLVIAGSAGSVKVTTGGNEIDFTRPGVNNIAATTSGGTLAFFSNGNGSASLFIDSTGKVGIGNGVVTPTNMLDVKGALSVGAGFAGVNTAPTNGLLVQGNVGIGTTSPVAGEEIQIGSAASTPQEKISGNWYTGGTATTTKPQLLIEPATVGTSNAWSTSGTGLGVNAPSGFSGNLIDTQIAGSEKFRVDNSGNAVASGLIEANGGTAYISSTGFYGPTVNVTTGGANGNEFVFTASSTGGLTAYTGSHINVTPTRNLSWGSSVTDTGSFLNLARSNTINDAGQTFTIQGDVADFSSNCTQTAGTCADTSSILSLNQQYASATGTVLKVVNSGTGAAATFMGGNVGIGTTAPMAMLDVYGSSMHTYLAGNTLTFNAGASYLQLVGNSTVNKISLYNSADLQIDKSGTTPLAYFQFSTGNVGIGTASPNANALLDVYSTSKGILPPRLTTANETAMGTSLPMGLVAYNTTNNELESFNGTAWEAVGANVADAAGSTGQVQFNNSGDLGADSNFFWDNTNKRLGIGTGAPGSMVEIYNGGVRIDPPADKGLTVFGVSTGNRAAISLVAGTGGDEWVLVSNLGAVANGNFSIYDQTAQSANPPTSPYFNITRSGNVGINIITPPNPLSVSPVQYATGTASQSTTTVTGSGTTFTSAMVGSELIFVNGTSAGTITAYTDATHLTVSTSQTVSSQGYTINYTGLNVTSTGNVGIGTTSPVATLNISNGNVTNQRSLRITNTGAGATGLQIDAANGSSWLIVGDSCDHDQFKVGATNRGIAFGNAGSSYNSSGQEFTFSHDSNGAGNALVVLKSVTGQTADLFQIRSPSGTAGDLLAVNASGNVGIGTTAPNAAALLDVFSTTQGLLPPRLTTANETAMGTSLPMGLVAYNTTNNELESFNGTAWEAVGANAADAAGTNGQVQFNSSGDLGADSNFFWDNTNKRLGIGTAAPSTLLSLYQSGAGDQISWGALGSIYGYIGVDATTQYPVIRAASGKGLSFRVGGSSTDSMTVASGGNVGIGTTGPQSALHVYGSSDPTIDIQSSANNGAMVNYIQPSRTLNLGMNSTGDFSLNDATAGLTRLFLKASNGALGIGNYGWSTYNPVNSLDVSGAMSVGYGLSPSTAPSNGMIVSGNVGIGTTAPSDTLTISGNNNLTFLSGGQINFNGNGFGANIGSDGYGIFNYLRQTTKTFLIGLAGANQAIKIVPDDTSTWRFDYRGESGPAVLKFTNNGSGNERMRIDATGNVGIGTASPNASALLDVYSTTQGFLPPRLTTANETAMGTSLPMGLVAYNTTNNELESFNGTAWEAVGANAADAAGTTGQVQFNNSGDLGADSNFFWDNTNKRLGIGTAGPASALHVGGGGNIRVDNGGTFLGGSNSAGTPTYGFYGTGGVGMFTPGSSALAFSTGNNERVRIDSSGNVGIGTTAPKFNVHSVIGTPGFVQSTATATLVGDNNSPLGSGSGVSYGVVGRAGALSAVSGDIAYGGYFTSSANVSSAEVGLHVATADANNATNAEFLSGANTVMVLKGNGNVGIGTTSPATLLDILGSGSGAYQLQLTNPTVNSYTQMRYQGLHAWQTGVGNNGESTFGVPGKFYFYDATANTMRMVIDTTGNVGIGTTAPSYPLEVQSSASTNIAHIYNSSGGGSAGGLLIETSEGNGTADALKVVTFQGSSPKTMLRVQDYGTSGGNVLLAETGYGNVGIGTTLPNYKLQTRVGTDQNFAVYGAHVLSDGITLLSVKDDASGIKGLELRGSIIDLTGGNVGIGTTSPSQSLEVNGVAKVDTGLILSLIYPPTDSTTAIQIDKANGTSNVLDIDTSNGRVGIGSTSPVNLLDLGGSSAGIHLGSAVPASTTAALYNNGGTLMWNGSAVGAGGGGVTGGGSTGYDSIWTGPTAIGTGLIYESGGQVGIGTASPLSTFSVYGGAISDTLSIGTTSTNGVVLANLTAATSSVAQFSPRLHFIGQGWETGTSASQKVDMIEELQPQSGAANPSGNLTWSSQINSGGYNPLMTLTSGGNVGIGTAVPVFDVGGGISLYNPSGAGIHLNDDYITGIGGSGFDIELWGPALDIHTYDNSDVIFETQDTGRFAVGGDGTITVEGGNFIVNSPGNVGIGTTAPQATLDVNGYARLALQSSQPVACSASNQGSIALTHLARMCVCTTSNIWSDLVTGSACSW